MSVSERQATALCPHAQAALARISAHMEEAVALLMEQERQQALGRSLRTAEEPRGPEPESDDDARLTRPVQGVPSRPERKREQTHMQAKART